VSPVPPAWAAWPRVLVTDAWLTNAGDAAIALATDALVRRLAPGAVVAHAAYGIAAVGDRYQELDLVPPLEELVGTRWAPPAPGLADAGPAYAAAADLVISQGGGFLHEAYRPWARIDALARVADRAPVVLLGQTIGEPSLAFARRALSGLLRAVRLVVVRDPGSARHLVSLGADPDRVVVGTDVALELVRGGGPGGRPGAPDGPVDVVLGGDALPVAGGSRPRLAAALLAAVAARTPGADLRVWSSTQGIPGLADDDEVIHAAVAALPAGDRDRVEVVPGHVDAHRLVALTGTAAAMVSMRLHPALLAAGQGVPTVLLLDDDKGDAVTGFGPGVAVVRGNRTADAEAAARLLATVRRSAVGPGPVEALAEVEAALAGVLDELRPPFGGLAPERPGRL
jgi:hypothetical protein